MAAGQRVSFTTLADDPVDDSPGIEPEPARRISVSKCLANPRNPRDSVGDLGDLAGIKDRQLQSCLGISPAAYLRLWPDDRNTVQEAAPDVVIINGCRRLAAARKFGRDRLLVVVDDSVAVSRASVLRAAYDENTGRLDFDPIEEARAVMAVVAEYKMAKEAAKAQGWSQSWISHRKNLLKIHPDLQQQVRDKARGGAGLPINVARRLGSVSGIETMDLAQQQAEVTRIVRADEEKARTKKSAQPQTSPSASAEEAEESAAVSTRQDQFSAENRDASTALPEQRATEGGGGDSATPHAAWVLPPATAQKFAALFAAQAEISQSEPSAVAAEAYEILADLYGPPTSR